MHRYLLLSAHKAFPSHENLARLWRTYRRSRSYDVIVGGGGMSGRHRLLPGLRTRTATWRYWQALVGGVTARNTPIALPTTWSSPRCRMVEHAMKLWSARPDQPTDVPPAWACQTSRRHSSRYMRDGERRVVKPPS